MGVKTETLLDAVTTTGAGSARAARGGRPGRATFQAKGTTTNGAGASAVKVQGSNDNSNWIDVGTITLTLATTESSDGFASDAAWVYWRGNVSSISGTGAAVTLIMGH
jgi:hypothetical protein